MKTLRKMKKGFTIVELVIVIAVIAVLTAILVPTFISISNKANEASDKSLVKNLNTALRMAEGEEGKNETMHGAVLDVERIAGIKLSQFVSRTGDEILWDSVADEFVWKTEKPAGRADHLLWTIVKTYDSSAQTFSMYAGHEWPDTSTSIAGLKVGFDVGFHEDFESISYVGVGTERTVVIRTDGGTLNINAPTDTVRHFGYLEHLNVTAVSTTASYHEYGYLKSLDNFGSGHFVAESTAEFEESREDLLTTIGSNTSNLGTIDKSHFEVPDPEEPAVVGDPVSNFTELQAAFANGGEYYLTENFEITSALQAKTDLTLDLNGHNLSINSSNQISNTIVSCENCVLTFNDSLGTGGIYNIAPSYTDAIFGIFGSADLIINGGTFLSADDMLLGGVGGTAGGNLKILGGTILGYVGILQGKTIVLGTVMTLHYYQEFMSLEAFDTHVVAADGYTVTGPTNGGTIGGITIKNYDCTKNS